MIKQISLIAFLIYSTGFQLKAQNCDVLFNHSLIVLDSLTYKSIKTSKVFDSNFSFSYEKTKNWEGIYIIGKDNYIEFFHPKSMKEETLPVGFSWICQASLKANCIENINYSNDKMIEFSKDEDYDYLSVYTQDSINLLTTWELKQKQYESWTHKPYHDSLEFLTVDYNHPSESDSSLNYLFHNVTGITIMLNSKDLLSVSNYLTLIGYSRNKLLSNKIVYSNATDFIELKLSDTQSNGTITTIHFDLNEAVAPNRFEIGNSEIVLENKKGYWLLNKSTILH